MSLITPDRGVRLSTGVFTDEELDYFDNLGPDYFPEEETHPVGESDYHYLSIHLAFQLLRRVFPEASGVHIAVNNFIYWDARQKGQVVGPDLYLVKGAGSHPRGVYKTWQEGGLTPNVVLEFASNKTWNSDLTAKKAIYEQILEVPEYFLFDPIGGRYPEILQGFRLEQGVYQPIQLRDGKLTSEQLGLDLVPSGIYLRFLDRKSGELIPTPEEVELSRQEANAENARLRAELGALKERLKS